jgi:hypothetical protein
LGDVSRLRWKVFPLTTAIRSPFLKALEFKRVNELDGFAVWPVVIATWVWLDYLASHHANAAAPKIARH